MKSREDKSPKKLHNTTTTTGGSPSSISSLTKPARFRFPFKPYSSSSTPSSSSSSSHHDPELSKTSTSGGGSPSGLFNLRGKLGLKSSSPHLRKSVSFSAGRPASAGGVLIPSSSSSILVDNNMDWKKKITPDHTNQAYREAVGRLRAILSPRPTTNRSAPGSPRQEGYSPPRFGSGRYASNLRTLLTKEKDANFNNQVNLNNQNQPSGGRQLPYPYGYAPFYSSDPSNLQKEDDMFGLMAFIQKQNDYITQLEKETKYSRDELGSMLTKVKHVIAENEELQQKQKSDLLSNMIHHLSEKTDNYGVGTVGEANVKTIPTTGNNSNIIFESKIAELEAQLSQNRRALRLAQEEIMEIRKGHKNPAPVEATDGSSNNNNPYASCDLHRGEIDSLIKEKTDLLDTMHKLKQMISDMKSRESDAAKKVKNSLDIVEQMQIEKSQSDMELRRLKEELERDQQRIRDMMQEHNRKLSEEKLQVERKYKQEIDQLNNQFGIELDSLTKARMELERQKRLEEDLRRELHQKELLLEEIRQEMKTKINHMQSDLASTLTVKQQTDQELINIKLNAEKSEREYKTDAAKLQAEINGLRKRLEQSDGDLIATQEGCNGLSEIIAQLQRENALAKVRLEGHIAANPELADADIVTLIQNLEEKHGKDMHDLEELIKQQNGLLDKMRDECKALTNKLEETGRQYKKLEIERNKIEQVAKTAQEKCDFYSSSHEQMTKRLTKLEDEDKNRSTRIFQLLTKQSGLLRENQNLQNEVAALKSKVTDRGAPGRRGV